MRTLFASSSVFALILGVSVNACSDKNQFAPNDVSLNSKKFGVDSSEDHQKSGSADAGDGTTKSLASGEMVNVLKAPEIKVVIKSGGTAGSGSGSSGSSGGSSGSSSGSDGSGSSSSGSSSGSSGSSSGSDGSGSSSSGSSSGSGMIVNNGLPQGLKNGIIGGNFDLDTYNSFDKIGVLVLDHPSKHTHMYAQYDQTGVNFFEIRDENTKNISEVIPSGVPFVFVVYNSSLSSSPVLNVNGNRVLPKDYDPKVSIGASSPVFHLGSVSIQNSTPLTGFSINFSMDEKNRLAGTIIALDPTDAKQRNTENLYRNGAFTIRAVRPEYARNSPTDRTGVLWEGALYCHDCNTLPTTNK